MASEAVDDLVPARVGFKVVDPRTTSNEEGSNGVADAASEEHEAVPVHAEDPVIDGSVESARLATDAGFQPQTTQQNVAPVAVQPAREPAPPAAVGPEQPVLAPQYTPADTPARHISSPQPAEDTSAAPSSSGTPDAAAQITDKPAVKVSDLANQLSATHPNLTAGMMPPPAPPSPKQSSPDKTLSVHDKVNTTDARLLLEQGQFKLQPGADTVPFQELVNLRLEDGVDVTRKEEYLSADEFKDVLGVDKAAFSKLPQWKQLQLKKAKGLF
eukprot:GHRR01006353.1.p1 GENE.GHRR01006353.1~~GHRR01006353.1.p1  ORF type:complete len:271 (+),score=94.45 GHRR01006353.1:73-885(+)